MKLKTSKQMRIKATSLRLFLVAILVVGSIATIIIFYAFQNGLKNQKNSQFSYSPAGQYIMLKNDLTSLGDSKTLIIESAYRRDNYQQKFKEDINRLVKICNLTVQDVSFKNNIPNLEKDQEAKTHFFYDLATVSIKEPISVENYFKLLKMIENNSPIMITQSIGLSKAEDGNGIKADPLKIGLMVRYE